MTALEMKVNALALVAIGTPEEQEKGRDTLRQLRDGLIPAPVLEDTATELLRELGFPEGHMGFELAQQALVVCYEQPRRMDNMSLELFPIVANGCGMVARRVDRNIRGGIAVMYREGDGKTLDAFFRGTVSQRSGLPTTGGFLRRCVRELKSRMEVTVC